MAKDNAEYIKEAEIPLQEEASEDDYWHFDDFEDEEPIEDLSIMNGPFGKFLAQTIAIACYLAFFVFIAGGIILCYKLIKKLINVWRED